MFSTLMLCSCHLFQNSHAQFTELDERINFVATKVVHLGDQLEGVNTPRARAVEAQRLMNFFSEFLSPEPLKSQLFTGGHFQVSLVFMQSFQFFIMVM